MRKLLLYAFLACLVMSVCRLQLVHASPDIHVPYDYATIQGAIDAATSGETIIVHGGTYYEHIIVSKRLTLQAEGSAIIDGLFTGTVVNVSNSNVVISGFTVRNSGNNWTQRDSAIFIRDRQYCFIEFNHVENSRLGVYMQQCSHITLTGNTFTSNDEAVRLDSSTYCTIDANIGIDNQYCIILSTSTLNTIKANKIQNSTSPLHLQAWSDNNTLYGNRVTESDYGILLSQSSNNIIFHNSFIDNVDQAWLGSFSDNNVWDIGWPDGGNYWSDHNNADVKSGQYQSGPGSDGIADTAYAIETGNLDTYPCAGPINYYPVDFIIPETIVVISNSSITDFQMNITQHVITFHATGETGVGFCRVDVPNAIVSAIWQNSYRVLVNQVPIEFGNWTQDETTYIYFRYSHSTREIVLIPELPTAFLLPLLMLATLASLKLTRRKHTQKL